MARRPYEPYPSRVPSDHPLWPAFRERTKNMHTTGEMLHIWWEMFLAGANAGAQATAQALILPEPRQEFINNNPPDTGYGYENQQAE